MVKFTGDVCVALLLARDIERQVNEDECICAWCDAAFKTLKRSVDNPATIDDEGHRILVRADKIRRKYWADLDKRNLKCAERAKKARLLEKAEDAKINAAAKRIVNALEKTKEKERVGHDTLEYA